MKNDDWNKICRRIPFEDGHLRSANPNVKMLSPAQAQKMYASPTQKQETPQLTIRDRIDKQRKENIKQNDAAFSSVNKQSVSVDPNTMLWPPVNPYAKEGKKHIEVIYEQPMDSIAVLSSEEAYEFLVNLYDDMGGKKSLDDAKTYGIGVIKASYESYRTAVGLGGLGVTAYTKNINGLDWVIVKNFRRHQQTLMKGNKWGAANPKVVKMGLGLKDIKGAARFVRFNVGVEFAFAAGINAVDFILNDETTLGDFVGNTSGDFIKGVIALGGAAALTAAFVPASATFLVTSVAFIGASFAMGKTINAVDEAMGYTDEMKEAIKELID